MSFNHTISAILRGHWMIERSWAEAHLPLVMNILNGKALSNVERSGNQAYEQPFVIDPKTNERYSAFYYNYDTGRLDPNPNIPKGSVGILPIGGPITKYNGECGEPGSIYKATQLNWFKKSANIGSVVLLMDTPGGEARAANALVSAIKGLGKPVLAYVDGMSASLGMWISAAADETYLSSKMDQVGSIGSYVMFADFTGYFEKQGVKIHEIYAPQSVDKNKNYRDARKGNYEAVEDDLKLHVDEFISFVKTSRPKSAAFEKEWDSGKMFYAADAVKYGLADGVRTFNQVITKAAWLAKRQK